MLRSVHVVAANYTRAIEKRRFRQGDIFPGITCSLSFLRVSEVVLRRFDSREQKRGKIMDVTYMLLLTGLRFYRRGWCGPLCRYLHALLGDGMDHSLGVS